MIHIAKPLSLLRYPGGKTSIAKELSFYIPKNIICYRELFFGGGSVFFYYFKFNKNIEYILNDLYQELYLFWYYVKNHNQNLIKNIIKLKNKYSNKGRELYDFLINSNNKDNLFIATKYFILNRLSYYGKERYYCEDNFDKKFTNSSINRIHKYQYILKNVNLYNLDYKELLIDNNKTFYFLDPPYYKNKDSKFYGQKGILHVNFNHQELANILKDFKNSDWILTIDKCNEIEEMFNFANIYNNDVRYCITSNHHINTELIISNMKINLKAQKKINQWI